MEICGHYFVRKDERTQRCSMCGEERLNEDHPLPSPCFGEQSFFHSPGRELEENETNPADPETGQSKIVGNFENK